MDRTYPCGGYDVGSIPTGSTDESNESPALCAGLSFMRRYKPVSFTYPSTERVKPEALANRPLVYTLYI